jgi:hypothetical protein
MGQYDNGFPWEDDENVNEQQSGKALREARDAAAKEAKDLKKQLDDALKQLTERNLKDVLQEKSLNPGLAKWISQDGIDGSDAAKVDEWLTANAELIGYKPTTPEEPAEADPRAAEFARMQGVQVNALPAGKLSEAASRVANAETFEDVNAALRSAL